MQVFTRIYFLKIFIGALLQIRQPFYTIVLIMKVETESLKTVGNYAKKIKRNRSRIYQMIHEGKLEIVKIDEVHFIKVEK